MTEDTTVGSSFRRARVLYWLTFVVALLVSVILGFTPITVLPALGAAS